MHVRFLVDPADLRRWQAEAIAGVLAATGGSGDIAARAGRHPPRLLDLCLAFEAMTARQGRSPLLDRIAPGDPGLGAASGAADLVIDLAASDKLPAANSGLVVSVAGTDVINGAAAVIAAGEEPLVELHAVASGEVRLVGRWRIAVENRNLLAPGLAATVAHAGEMLRIAAARIAAGALPADLDLFRADATPPSSGGLAGFALQSLASRLAGRLDRLVRTPPRWAVAWRHDSTGNDALPAIAGQPWRQLADDGRRFFADPFVWRHAGRDVLFVEEFPFATRRGIISAVELGPDGPAGTPRPVIETGCHLSYPFVFEEDGTVYMIPETSGRRTIELWRATAFPDRWEPVAELIGGIDASDATLCRSGGRWHLFMSRRPAGGSSWDDLSIFVADRLTGPYSPIGDGPVKVDVATARPAGRMFEAGGALIRPFQDSRGGYGAGLGLARVDRLDAGGFAETVLTTLRPARPLCGLHTYNRGAGFEVIDVIARPGDAVVIA